MRFVSLCALHSDDYVFGYSMCEWNSHIRDLVFQIS